MMTLPIVAASAVAAIYWINVMMGEIERREGRPNFPAAMAIVTICLFIANLVIWTFT